MVVTSLIYKLIFHEWMLRYFKETYLNSCTHILHQSMGLDQLLIAKFLDNITLSNNLLIKRERFVAAYKFNIHSTSKSVTLNQVTSHLQPRAPETPTKDPTTSSRMDNDPSLPSSPFRPPPLPPALPSLEMPLVPSPRFYIL